MKSLVALILFFGLITFNLFSQTTIDVAETTFKLAGLGGEEVFHFGFAEGDEIIFSFQEVNGKELKEVEIVELPSSSKFMDFKATAIHNKVLSVPRTGIYKFRFANSAIGGRVCKVKIQRIPASADTEKFNTSVFWKTVQDTTYTPTEERFLVKSDTTKADIYSSNTQISSQNALNGNKNSVVIDFDLPENTISWSFYIGTGNEGQAEFDRVQKEFVENAASSLTAIYGLEPMAALALTGVSYFNKVQGEDNVKFWFLSDANSVALFNAGQEFYQYKMGDVVNEASQMTKPLKGKVYIGLLNDNTIDPIKVLIKATAIQVKQEWATRIIQVMNVENRQEPYLKN